MRQKNKSARGPLKLPRTIQQFSQHRYARILLPIVTFILLTATVALVLFWRQPNNVTAANFYGEDGSVYLQNILRKGWLLGSLTPFNGYSIIGLYLLEAFGWLANLVVGDGLLTLPVAFAVVSIVFMAAVISLPYLLFRKVFGSVTVLLVIIFSALMPLPLSPHIVIGTIGNDKWIFLYLAFLLVLYRVLNFRKLRVPAIIAIDGLILLSAYTNSAVYALVPVLFWPYLKEYWNGRKRKKLFHYLLLRLRQVDFASLVGLCVLLLPQVAYVAWKGIPKLPGYLDNPFQFSKTIEVFINRTYVFGLTHVVNGHMSDIGAVLLFGTLIYLGVRYLKGAERFAFCLGIYVAGIASLLFVSNRPGVSDFFFGYQSTGSGPDQFFYAQTLIMYLPIVLAIQAVVRNIRKPWLRYGSLAAVSILIIAGGLISNARYGTQWRHSSVYENDAGTFIDQAIKSCGKSDQSPVRVTVYPYATGQFSLDAPRDQVCSTQLKHYQSSVQDLGLKLNNNDYLSLTKDKEFTQTFIASESKLDGVRLFISNFGKNIRRGSYVFLLQDATCTTTLRSVPIPAQLVDNSLYNIHFPSIPDSKDTMYCFTLSLPNGPYDPIAIQRSQPDEYPQGVYTENGRELIQDAVFFPLYSQEK